MNEPENTKVAHKFPSVVQSLRQTRSRILNKNDFEDPEQVESIPNFRRLPKIAPQIGFEGAAFAGTDAHLVGGAGGNRFFTHINLENCNDEIHHFDMQSTISAWIISHNYRLLIFCVDAKQGAMIVVKDSREFNTLAAFPVR